MVKICCVSLWRVNLIVALSPRTYMALSHVTGLKAATKTSNPSHAPCTFARARPWLREIPLLLVSTKRGYHRKCLSFPPSRFTTMEWYCGCTQCPAHHLGFMKPNKNMSQSTISTIEPINSLREHLVSKMLNVESSSAPKSKMWLSSLKILSFLWC